MELQIRPDRSTFDALASEWPLVPVWAELLADVSTPVGLFPAIAGEGPGSCWNRWNDRNGGADTRSWRANRRPWSSATARGAGHRGRAGAAPRRRARARPARPWSRSRGRCARLACPICPPPLVGGLMGYVAFEAAELLDGHPVPDLPRRRSLRSDCSSSTAPWSSITGISACSWSPTCRPDGSTRGVAALEALANRVHLATPPELPGFPAGTAAIEGRAEHARRALPRDRRRRSRSTSARATSTRACRRDG